MDARLREGIRLFNTGRYFESHELWEDFYLHAEEEHRPFLEGLIELAAALRVFCDLGELKGAVRMIHQALLRLENYQPTHLGIRVEDLIQAMEAWTEKARADHGGPNSKLRDEIPKVRLRRFLLWP